MLALASTTAPTHTTADVKHEQRGTPAIAIRIPEGLHRATGKHTATIREPPLRSQRRGPRGGSSCTNAMDGSVQMRLGRVGRREQQEQQSAFTPSTRTMSVLGQAIRLVSVARAHAHPRAE